MEARSARRIDTPESVAVVVSKLPRFDPCETGFVFYLDSDSCLISVDVIKGYWHEVYFPLRKMVDRARGLAASGMAVAHTHPAGHPDPSPPDVTMGSTIASALRNSGLRFYGNYIVSGSKAYPFPVPC